MYCSKCGKEIFDEAVVCPHCGTSVRKGPEVKVKEKRGDRKLGVPFIICGAVNLLLSGIFASLPVNYFFYGIVRSSGTYSQIRLMDTASTMSYIHVALAVISGLLLVLGIVFTAIKKPLISKKSQKLLAVLMPVGLAVLNLLILLPFISYVIKFG